MLNYLNRANSKCTIWEELHKWQDITGLSTQFTTEQCESQIMWGAMLPHYNASANKGCPLSKWHFLVNHLEMIMLAHQTSSRRKYGQWAVKRVSFLVCCIDVLSPFGYDTSFYHVCIKFSIADTQYWLLIVNIASINSMKGKELK